MIPARRRVQPFYMLVVFAVTAAALMSAVPQAGAGLPVARDRGGVPTLAPILKRITPGVVNISVRGSVQVQQNPLFNDPFFRRFFDLPEMPQRRQTQSVGSGVIVDSAKGYILTNHHVIKDAEKIAVTLKDGRTLEAKLVGGDPATDIAVLKVESDGLVEVPFGDSEKLEVGDFVIAIGNPFGLGQTVTSGIVSALGRSGLKIEGYEDFIQTDASINPGNSGGALVDLNGKLIGINTAIIGPSGGNVGIGFAVPVNMARSVMDQILRYGEVRRGRLGVSIQDMTPELAEALKIPSTGGVIVVGVEAGSGAASAGIQPGDVITHADGHRLRNSGDLRNRVGLMRIGDKVQLKISRKGKPLTVTVRIGESGARKPAAQRDQIARLPGARFRNQRGVAGAVVGEVVAGSPAWRFGLRQGDVITIVNGQQVRSLGEFERAVKANKGTLALNVRRDGETFLVVVG